LVVVPPVTVAVRVVDWPTIITVPTDEPTLTVTALAALLPPPQPAAKPAAIIAAAVPAKIVRNFILPPPKQIRVAAICALRDLTPPTSCKVAVAGVKMSG
jgi:hypothetical protein